jgi:hypothetical protein
MKRDPSQIADDICDAFYHSLSMRDVWWKDAEAMRKDLKETIVRELERERTAQVGISEEEWSKSHNL